MTGSPAKLSQDTPSGADDKLVAQISSPSGRQVAIGAALHRTSQRLWSGSPQTDDTVHAKELSQKAAASETKPGWQRHNACCKPQLSGKTSSGQRHHRLALPRQDVTAEDLQRTVLKSVMPCVSSASSGRRLTRFSDEKSLPSVQNCLRLCPKARFGAPSLSDTNRGPLTPLAV